MAENIAIIVAVENYKDKDIKKVAYAINDANGIKNLLERDFDIEPKNIHLFLDNNATKTSLENDIPYLLKNLEEDDRLYFYYAGHGFSNNALNYFTAWDTSSFNLVDTSISLQESILSLILNSKCSRSLLFLDTCATKIKRAAYSRDIISDMNLNEFRSFIKSAKYSATFLSCSPTEKSYSSPSIEHGVWTYHLLKALSGKEEKAIVRKKFITDSSLKDYLATIVPSYIRKNMSVKGTQTPQAIITSTNTFEIREIIEKSTPANPDFPKINLNTTEAYLRNIEANDFKYLPGISKKRGHFIPETFSSDTDEFIQKMTQEEFEEEIKEIYNNCKNYLKLKRSEISKETVREGGTIHTEYFRYNLYAAQSDKDPAQYYIYRLLHIRKTLDELPAELENIFPNKFNEIAIPISGKIDFDEIVERFEDFESIDDGYLDEDDSTGVIVYKMNNGLELIIDTKSKEFILNPHSPLGVIGLIETTKLQLKYLFGKNIKLLE